MRKFQALGRVNSHELDGFAPFCRVGVGKQGHMVQVIGKQSFLPARRLILIDRLPKLREIVKPLLAPLRPQRFLIAALLKHRGDKLRDRHVVTALIKISDHIEEFPGSGPSENLLIRRLYESIDEQAVVLFRVLPEKSHPLFADISLRLVDDSCK